MITLESTLKPASGISFQSMGLEQTGVVLSLGSGRLSSRAASDVCGGIPIIQTRPQTWWRLRSECLDTSIAR